MCTGDGRAEHLILALREELARTTGAPVELIETHISWLLLTAERAYKLKKPLTLPFLDYGTPAQREQCCRAEVDLNRRFAPGLYLGVVAIGGDARHPRPGGQPVLAHAVEMRRFGAAQEAHRLCAAGLLTPELLMDFGRRLAELQRGAGVATEAADDSELRDALENFEELQRLLPDAEQATIAALSQWTLQEHQRHAREWTQRRDAGFIREGHGDLHLGNLFVEDGRMMAFDCVEFNSRLRRIDVISDVAFLWMDLIDHGHPPLAAAFLNAWLENSGDFSALRLLPFYAVYRAMVRAKVAALRRAQAGSADAPDKCRHYLEFGLRLAEVRATGNIAVPPPPTFARPRLLITCGLSGSGKSTRSAAWLLADPAARCIRIRSDVERKRLFGLQPDQSSAAIAGGIYDAGATRRTFERLAALADDLLAAGYSVVVDAAFLGRGARQRFRQLAADCGASFGILHCTASTAELEARLQARRDDVSEATVDIARQQAGWFEPLTEAELRECVESGHGAN